VFKLQLGHDNKNETSAALGLQGFFVWSGSKDGVKTFYFVMKNEVLIVELLCQKESLLPQ